jgi:hypothetical protein
MTGDGGETGGDKQRERDGDLGDDQAAPEPALGGAGGGGSTTILERRCQRGS